MAVQDLHARLEDFALELQSMQQKLRELRQLAGEQEAAGARSAPATVQLRTAVPRPAQPPRITMPPPTQPPVATRPTPPPQPARKERRELDLGALFGARALACSGGAVTVLGVVR